MASDFKAITEATINIKTDGFTIRKIEDDIKQKELPLKSYPSFASFWWREMHQMLRIILL